jgi:hypothetical protein
MGSGPSGAIEFLGKSNGASSTAGAAAFAGTKLTSMIIIKKIVKTLRFIVTPYFSSRNII